MQPRSLHRPGLRSRPLTAPASVKFPAQARQRLRLLADRFAATPPTATEVAALAAEWAWAEENEVELLTLAAPDGRPTGETAPRWLAHLTGMPHLTVHVALATPTGLIVLQRRSHRKRQFPGAWDITVTGHASPCPDSADPLRQAAIREMEEEVGLPAAIQDQLLAPPGLCRIGRTLVTCAEGECDGRPWIDVEARCLFGGVLTPAGTAALRYPADELAGLLLASPADAAALLSGREGAAGASDSLEEFISWLAAPTTVVR